MSNPSPDPMLGRTLAGKYRLDENLGGGGMGATYRAFRLWPRDYAVVKVMHAKLASDPTFGERFRREALAASLVEHANVVKIYDYEPPRDGEPAFIVMELVEGQPLDQLLKKERRLAPERAVHLLCEICAGVGAAHTRDEPILHRDLKPANIMVLPERDGQPETVKILDFGLAKLLNTELTDITNTQAALGTPLYMPPEQWRNRELGPPTDVYSLGCILYEMLTATHPFFGQTRDEVMVKHLLDPPPDIDAALKLAPDLIKAVLAALEKTPAQRPANALKLAQHLRAALPPPAPAIVTPQPFSTYVEMLPGGVPLEMILLPADEFDMGSPKGEAGRFDDETQHRVILSRPFYIGKYPVTQAQWRAVMGDKVKPHFTGDDLPMERVSWDEAQEFCRKLGREYRLPTEAEWEYACRAGTTGAYAGNLDEMAWYGRNSDGKTHPVGAKKANDWGLCDMHGNVWEWCNDWDGPYSDEPVNDPKGPTEGSFRIRRGGGWVSTERYARSAFRNNEVYVGRHDDLGFRLVREFAG